MALRVEDVVNFPKTALRALVPSYLQRGAGMNTEVARRRSNTSALDGLRGIAALFVFFFHVLFSYTRLVEFGYGQSETNTSLMQLPLLSIWHRGHSMVAIFFVVGGYVMAIKPISLIHGREGASLHRTLVSSVFRRGIRLYLPAVVATLLTMLTIYLGLWEYPRQFITDDHKYIVYSDLHPERKATLGLQVWAWLGSTWMSTDLFNYYNKDGFLLPYYNPYDPHLWTVPFEFRSSLIVTMVLLSFARCKTFARLLLISVVILFCGAWDRWELVCFLSGTLLCDLDQTIREFENRRTPRLDTILEEDEEKLPEWESIPLSTSPRIRHWMMKMTEAVRGRGTKRWLVLFGVGLYLLSTPNLGIEDTPGYRTLYLLTPSTYTDKKRFLQSLGAIFTTWSVTSSAILQKPFNTSFAQYLGKISYSLYIVHGPLIHVVGYSITPNIWIWVTGMEGWNWMLGLVLGSLVLGVWVAVVADLFWRVVDLRAVRLARWFEELCFVAD